MKTQEVSQSIICYCQMMRDPKNILCGVAALLTFIAFFGESLAKREHVSTQPEQVHLSFGNDESEIVVTWTTLSQTISTSTVEYGIDEMNLKSTGASKVFVDGGWKQRAIYIHRVVLTNLQPSSRYVYRCGGDEGWSNEFWFKTTPSGTNWSPRLTIYGDMGYTNAVSFARVQSDAQNHEIDAVIHVGDFAYNFHNKNGKLGDMFMNMIEPAAAHVPYMVCPGNHERAYNFSHYKERFTMPGNSENLFFSFHMGPVHFISVDTEAYWYYQEYGMDLLVNQYNWLVKDLQEANENRAERPWIVLYGHRPMYCSGKSAACNTDAPTRSGLDKKSYGLEILLQKFGVDIVFWGHQHNYERFWPIFDYTVKNGSMNAPYVNPKAPVHIITGSAGCWEDIKPFSGHNHPALAFRNTNYGITEVQFHNSTHMSLRQVATDDNNKVVDQIVLVKDFHGPYDSS